MVGLNESAVAIENAEAVGVTVGGQTGQRFLFQDQLFQRRQIFFRRIRTAAVEQHVAFGAYRFDGHAVVGQNAVEPARAAAMQGVVGEIPLGLGQDVEANHFLQLLEVRLPRIEPLEVVFDVVIRHAIVGKLRRPGFDVLGDFRQRGPAVGAGEFQTVVGRRVVAGGDVHAPFEFVIDDGMRQDRRWRGVRAENDVAAVVAHHAGGGARKFRREESRVVPNDNCGILFPGGNMARDGLGRASHAGKGKIIGDDAAPAGSSEMDNWFGHGPTLYRGLRIEITQETNESQE